MEEIEARLKNLGEPMKRLEDPDRCSEMTKSDFDCRKCVMKYHFIDGKFFLCENCGDRWELTELGQQLLGKILHERMSEQELNGVEIIRDGDQMIAMIPLKPTEAKLQILLTIARVMESIWLK